jgi:hypothetical protein
MADTVKSAWIVLWQERRKPESLRPQEIKLQTFMVVTFIGIIYFKTKKKTSCGNAVHPKNCVTTLSRNFKGETLLFKSYQSRKLYESCSLLEYYAVSNSVILSGIISRKAAVVIVNVVRPSDLA